MKFRKSAIWIALSSLGVAYFAVFSNLELHPLIEIQLFALPIQGSLLLYLLVLRPRAQKSQQKGDHI